MRDDATPAKVRLTDGFGVTGTTEKGKAMGEAKRRGTRDERVPVQAGHFQGDIRSGITFEFSGDARLHRAASAGMNC